MITPLIVFLPHLVDVVNVSNLYQGLEGKELAKIDEFLKANPFFDFSTLTRMAIQKFIENPQVQIRGITSKQSANKRQIEV